MLLLRSSFCVFLLRFAVIYSERCDGGAYNCLKVYGYVCLWQFLDIFCDIFGMQNNWEFLDRDATF